MTIGSPEDAASWISGMNAMPALTVQGNINNERADSLGNRETVEHQDLVVIDGMAKIE